MIPSDRAAAKGALAQGRAVYTRLDQIRTSEDAAADIIDLWSAAQSAMQAMLGGTLLSGQHLVRELRQRDILNLDQANALASFWDARERVNDVSYKPTLTDVGYARAGYNELTAALEEKSLPPISMSAPAAKREQGGAASDTRVGGPVERGGVAEPVATGQDRRRLSPIMLIGAALAVLLAVGIAAYLTLGRSPYDKQMAAGIDLMRSGAIEGAQAQFSQIARQNPARAEPHIFMARLSRNVGDLTTARQQLDTALHIDPSSAMALREMGLLMLSRNDAELARRFLVRAVQVAPTDSAALGYLGCALMELNRPEEARRFFNRAGTGSWSSCATSPLPAAASSK